MLNIGLGTEGTISKELSETLKDEEIKFLFRLSSKDLTEKEKFTGDGYNFVFKWAIKDNFCETEDSKETILKQVKDLTEKIFRMGRNASNTIRYYVDNIEWEMFVEDKDLIFIVKVKEGEMMEDLKKKKEEFLVLKIKMFEVIFSSFDLRFLAGYFFTPNESEELGKNTVSFTQLKFALESDQANKTRDEKKAFIKAIYEKFPFIGAGRYLDSLLMFKNSKVELYLNDGISVNDFWGDMTEFGKYDLKDLKNEYCKPMEMKQTRSVIAMRDLLRDHFDSKVEIEYTRGGVKVEGSVDGGSAVRKVFEMMCDLTLK